MGTFDGSPPGEGGDQHAWSALSADRELPGRADPLVARLSSVVGGPVGAHALIGRQRFLTPLRVVLVVAVVFLALGWFSKAACIQQHPYGPDGALGLDWGGNRQYVALCYSDTVPLYGAERLNEGAFPYKKSWQEERPDGSTQVRYMEYPVLSGLYQYGAAAVASAWYNAAQQGWLPGALAVALYFNTVAFGLALAWLVTVWATAALLGRRVWWAWLAAASPLVVVHVFTNYDALATGFAAAGLLAWARKRPLLAGVLLGLGGAAKLYPLFLLGPLLVLCLRAGTLRQWVQALLAALAAWLAVNLPIMVLYWDGWYEFFRLNSERGMDPDSLYNVVRSFTGWQGFDGPLAVGQKPVILNAVSGGLFALACLGVAFLALHAPRRPRVAQLCFLVVAAFLLTNKVWSPQYSLWLVPLAVLALPHTRVLLAWMTVDALVWVPRMFYYHGIANKGLPEQWFTATVLVRDLAVLGLCALVVRQVYRPGEDLVRRGAPGADPPDDPVGGPLDGAPDRYVLRLRKQPARSEFGRPGGASPAAGPRT